MSMQIFDYILSEAGLAAAEGSLRGDICSSWRRCLHLTDDFVAGVIEYVR